MQGFPPPRVPSYLIPMLKSPVWLLCQGRFVAPVCSCLQREQILNFVRRPCSEFRRLINRRVIIIMQIMTMAFSHVSAENSKLSVRFHYRASTISKLSPCSQEFLLANFKNTLLLHKVFNVYYYCNVISSAKLK